MENEKSLAELTREISSNLLDSKYLIEILKLLADGDAKMDTILGYLDEKVTLSFLSTEKSREMICINN